ncbi:MAG: ferritin [Candidatus Cloacimonetes bacterium]|nr:ferritin [Candidatus Cloacimonadota bacterium]MCF7867243.1 ferritin [Candidatus Cloacimonadota bacterium]MCF7882687.1 ferritin [Candidatus Cloacimonadota bacterium]
MIPQKIEKAINKQINKELFSEYLYLSMATWFAAEGLDGFENFFIVQAQEERFHAMKFYKFIKERGGRVILKKLEDPKTDFASIEEIFKLAFDHEIFISKSINEIMDLAIEEKDHATRSFLNWFVDEQVEEEDTMQSILDKLKLIGGKGQGILMMDSEMAKRTFTPTAAE